MKRYSHRRYVSTLSLVIFVSFFLTSCATVKMHPEFNERHEDMRRLAVLPSDIDAYEVTFNTGNKPLAELKTLIQNKTSSSIHKILTEKGYEVIDVQLTQEDLNTNSALKNTIFNIHTMYEQAIKDMADRKQKEFTYEIGASPNYFAESNDVNAIVIMRQRGHRLSKGVISAQIAQTTASIITAALVGVSAQGETLPTYQLTTEVAIVDAELGDILWYHVGQTTRNYTKPEDNKTIFEHIKALMKPLIDSKFKNKPSSTPPPMVNLSEHPATHVPGHAPRKSNPGVGPVGIKGGKSLSTY